MVFVLMGVLGANQLADARIVIDVGSSETIVVAEYAFLQPLEQATFDLMRLPGQAITLRSPRDVDTSDLGGLLRVTPLLEGLTRFRFEYQVKGNSERTPLLIPNHPTTPGTSDVTIEVRGVAPDVPLADAFPRFVHHAGGTLLSRPANLPSFVLMPAAPRASRARIADGVVLFLLIAATGLWVGTRVRSLG